MRPKNGPTALIERVDLDSIHRILKNGRFFGFGRCCKRFYGRAVLGLLPIPCISVRNQIPCQKPIDGGRRFRRPRSWLHGQSTSPNEKLMCPAIRRSHPCAVNAYRNRPGAIFHPASRSPIHPESAPKAKRSWDGFACRKAKTPSDARYGPKARRPHIIREHH